MPRLVAALAITSLAISAAPADEPARIYVYAQRLTNARSWLRISCDGKTVASVKQGWFFAINAGPGPHVLDSENGVPLVLNLQNGEQAYVRLDWHMELGASSVPVLSVVPPEQARKEMRYLSYIEPGKAIADSVPRINPRAPAQPQFKKREAAGPAPSPFVIHLDAGARAADLQVWYFLRGGFGGYGGELTAPAAGDHIEIPAGHDGKPAKALRAVLFQCGCEMAAIRVDDLDSERREARFGCRPLPSIRLKGRVDPSLWEAGNGAEVRVDYLGFWTHTFFGFMDGMVTKFRLGRVPVQADGSFAVDLPDFVADPIYAAMGREAELHVLVHDARTKKVLAGLPSFLKIDRAYPSIEDFKVLSGW